MISFLSEKLILWIFRRAFRNAQTLVYLSVYKRLRDLNTDTTRETDGNKAVDLCKKLAVPAHVLDTADKIDSATEAKEHAVVSCDDVRNALGYYFSIQCFFYSWVESNNEAFLNAQADHEAALKVLGIETWPKSTRDLLELTKEISIKIKALRKELYKRDRKEAADVIYSIWFPETLNFNQLASLFGILSFAYIAGTYIFTHVVFFKINSEIVGLNQKDYFAFTTQHCVSKIPLVLLGFYIAMKNQVTRAKNIYLSQDFGISPKRLTGFDALIWFALITMNIPVFLYIVGLRDGVWQQVLTFDVQQVVIFDVFLLITVVIRELPYERIVLSWFAIHTAFVSAMMLMFLMLMTGWDFAESLKKTPEEEWNYVFDDTSFSSDEYSLVFEGERSIVFYHRNSQELEVINAQRVKSFTGRL